MFAATRSRHVTLARRAARTLRRVAPDALIDLFTDEMIEDDVFDEIHLLNKTNTHRPKIEALRRARFEKTVCLDSDIVAVADPSDMFDLLDRFEIIGAHDNSRNSKNARLLAGEAIPAAFPSINSGVVGVQKNPRTRALLQAWIRRMRAANHRVDQPAFRDVLWDSDIRLGILPIEYNLMDLDQIWTMTTQEAAPRLLHMRQLNQNGRPLGDPLQPFDPGEILSKSRLRRLKFLIAHDKTLSHRNSAALEARELLSPGWRSLRARILDYAGYNHRFRKQRDALAREREAKEARKSS